MLLKDYVKQNYDNNLDYYKDTVKYANLSQPGFTYIGNVETPYLEFIELITKDDRKDGHNLDNFYTYGRHPKLDRWAQETFPNIKFQDCRSQLQEPGNKVDPHVDTLIGHIEKWIAKDSTIGEIDHSLENPNPYFKAVRYFIAMEDHIEGQDFIINNKKWIWKKGDVISLNVWRGVHNTINNSNKNRFILKVTGIEE